MIAGNLLLSGAFWISLNVRVEKTTTIAHILNGRSGSIGDFERTVFSDFGATEVCLEQGAHLGISWATVLQNCEVKHEGEDVNDQWNDNEANNPGNQVSPKGKLEVRLAEVILHIRLSKHTGGILVSPNLFQRSSIV